MTLPLGYRLGPYEIVALLGAGGMGMVYRSRDTRLQRDVAIKVLSFGLLGDDSARRRFHKEALALAKLSHPNIAAVYDVGEQDGIDYLVMECVPGESLATRLTAGPLSPEDALSIGTQIAAALEEAHGQGVVHRDLKPANVMVTPKGHAKVLDFGLAKMFASGDIGAPAQSQSEIGVRVGTLLYMSPEQAFGETVDLRTDLWSLGVLLYEAITGTPPFQGTVDLAVMRAVTETTPAPLSDVRPGTPPAVERVVGRALTRDLSKRYQSAAEMGGDMSAALATMSGRTAGAPQHAGRGRLYAGLAMAALVLLAIAGVTLYRRVEQRQWALAQAVPQITKLLSSNRSVAAFLTLKKAEPYFPADSAHDAVKAAAASTVTILSSPAGATVNVRDYDAPDTAWYTVGRTPLRAVAMPTGYLRWKISSAGLPDYVAAPVTLDTMKFDLDSLRSAPSGMVHVSEERWSGFIAFVGWLGPYNVPAYDIDRYEVTNQAYQAFVDQHGYDRPELWREKIMKDGRELSHDEAMALFRDRTGRAGPSTWEGGHFPAGQANYPVTGVSWYEASAYAAFAGKSLPTLAQWYRASPAGTARYLVASSNISRTAIAPVGTFGGLGIFGTYDMAGNAREWAENPIAGDERFLLGGAATSQSYIAMDPEAAPPLDRSPTNGFRCVRNSRPLSQEIAGAVSINERDFAAYRPADDEVFRAYRAFYAYDKTPLNARIEGVIPSSADWTKQKISFDAAYGGDRVIAYLFLPKHVQPPYQTVVFFPSARVADLTDSRTLGDTSFFDYVVQSGRAVLYPVYEGTYERRLESTGHPGASQKFIITVDDYRDFARSLDYLETRSDIAHDKIAYLGVSMGAAYGVILTALEQDRLKTVIFLDGGFWLDQPHTGGDQADFAPRITKPVLMVNGRYDFSFSLERAQNPLFGMLGTPAADKRHRVLETPHDVRADRPELIREVLGWLDKYLGRVN